MMCYVFRVLFIHIKLEGKILLQHIIKHQVFSSLSTIINVRMVLQKLKDRYYTERIV